MQKHERLCLQHVKEILEPHGFTVTTSSQGNAKMKITATSPAGTWAKPISSSPKDRDNELGWATRWAKRIVRDAQS